MGDELTKKDDVVNMAKEMGLALGSDTTNRILNKCKDNMECAYNELEIILSDMAYSYGRIFGLNQDEISTIMTSCGLNFPYIVKKIQELAFDKLLATIDKPKKTIEQNHLQGR